MDKTEELSTELSTETETIDDDKMEKPKKKRPPATPAQIEARKKNFEKMLQKRTEESLALAQKKVNDKLKKKEERKAGKTETEEPPIETPKLPLLTKVEQNKQYGSVRERRVPDEDYEVIEEHITKKPKKKRIVYREESDSEEEVIIRKKKPVKETPVVEPVKEEPKKITQLIRFF
jgi:hypothetical protein